MEYLSKNTPKTKMEGGVFSERILGDILNYRPSGTIIALLVVLLLSVYYLLFARNKLNLPPGPIGLPLLGYWPFLVKDPHKTLNRLAKKYGNIFSLYLGQDYCIVCNDWPAVKDALSKTESLNRPTSTFRQIPNGIGFGGANGQEWSEQRKFTIKAMKDIGLGRPQWEDLAKEEVDEIVKRIETKIGQPIDIADIFGCSFTNNIMTMLFGHRLPYGDPAVKRLSQIVDIAMQQSPSLGLRNFLPSLSKFLLKIGVWGSKEALDRVKEFTVDIHKCIQEKLKNEELVDEESFVNTYFQEIQQNKKKNLNNSFTDESLQGNTQSLMLGGSETTHNSFIWLLVSMAEHPEKQGQVHRELDKVLGKNGTIKWADRTKVPYTFATIMESMRWKSLVPISTLRTFSADTKVLGYDVPKGTIIVTNSWALHNDPKYWKDPEKFEPERFLQDGGNSFNFKPDSYIPFSFGRRGCPGEMIALTEILLYFTTLMQKFTILPQDGDTRVKCDAQLGLTYQPVGVRLRFLARD